MKGGFSFKYDNIEVSRFFIGFRNIFISIYKLYFLNFKLLK